MNRASSKNREKSGRRLAVGLTSLGWPGDGAWQSRRYLLLGIGLSLVLVIAARALILEAQSPEEVALSFARAVYARDYPLAWEYLASEDQRIKSRDTYLAENVSYGGLRLELTQRLAEWIQFTDVEVAITNDRAEVTAHVIAPNGNEQEVQQLIRAAKQEEELSSVERRELLERLDELYLTGELDFLEGEQAFRLKRGADGWRMVMGWSDAIEVQLTAKVASDLPWDFYPLQDAVRALPGETIRVTYRAINQSDRTVTGKAKHLIVPDFLEDYITTVQCFCLIQQTLAPGESQDMTMMFRLEYELPEEIRWLESAYVFYPIELFPEE